MIKVKKTFYSLTGKLLLTIGTLMVGDSIILAFFLIRNQERELIDKSVRYGLSFTDYVKKSTHHGMLTFQGHLIQQTVEALGSAEWVKKINLFDSKGKIAYSSLKKEIGTILDISHPVCISCHGAGAPKIVQRWVASKDEEGQRVLNIIEPIYNEPACYTASCHAHPKEQKVLGLVEADLSLAF